MGISSSLIGLTIVYSLTITQTLNWMVRQSCEIETNIVSVERMKQYIEMPTEAAQELETDPVGWPSEGDIDFTHYSTRYREGLELVVKDIDFYVRPKEKIGIVGRTGKCTLLIFQIFFC